MFVGESWYRKPLRFLAARKRFRISVSSSLFVGTPWAATCCAICVLTGTSFISSFTRENLSLSAVSSGPHAVTTTRTAPAIDARQSLSAIFIVAVSPPLEQALRLDLLHVAERHRSRLSGRRVTPLKPKGASRETLWWRLQRGTARTPHLVFRPRGARFILGISK